MNKIRFSHNYPKLWNQHNAKLIAVELVHFNMIKKELIEYDTRTCEGRYYPLKKTKYLQLIFLGDKRIPFCTLRSYNGQKYDYYKSKIGESFIVEFPNE